MTSESILRGSQQPFRRDFVVIVELAVLLCLGSSSLWFLLSTSSFTVPKMRSISSGERERISENKVLASSQRDTKGRLLFARKKDTENQYKPPIANRGITKSNFSFFLFLIGRRSSGDDGMANDGSIALY